MSIPVRIRRGTIFAAALIVGVVLSFVMLFAVKAQSGRAARSLSPQAFCDNVTEIPIAECEALVALYSSTNGANWANSTGWLATNTPCSWYGVTCTNNHVTSLSLYSNQLNGSIPTALADLAQLQELLLNMNQLTGHIPPELGNLSSLQILNLAINQIDGPIPPELGNLTNLERLTLSEMYYLTGTIPAELGQLTNLLNLNLCESFQIEGSIPPELGNLENLESLSLCAMDLSGPIPEELGQLSKLRSLQLYGNHLIGPIPSAIGDLVNLTYMCLHSNTLRGEIPASITKLVNLNSDETWAWPCNWDPDEGYTSLKYNMLSSTNPDVIAFLDNKDPGWDETQTVPPTSLHVAAAYPDSLDLTWTPILYTQDGGYYEIFSASQHSGPFALLGDTITKTASITHISGLQSGASYYFKLRTFTPAHYAHSDPLWSDFTDPLGFTFNAIQPENGGTLVITDTSSTVTEVTVPPGAVEETVTMGLSSVETVTSTANLLFASQAFVLEAYQDGALHEDFTFDQPVTITINYTDADVMRISEDSLTLLYWDGSSGQWVDAATTCSPPSFYERHPEDNWLSVPICHLSQFALFGNGQPTLFLPLVRR